MCAHMQVGCEEHAALQAQPGNDILDTMPVQAVRQDGDGRLVHISAVPADRAPRALRLAAACTLLSVAALLLRMCTALSSWTCSKIQVPEFCPEIQVIYLLIPGHECENCVSEKSLEWRKWGNRCFASC